MIIGRVTGEVVATQQHASHAGMKILMVAPLDLANKERGQPFVAFDTVGAGVGDRVLLATDGWAAMTAVGRPNSPIDAAILGVIDEIDLVEE
jgi:ethanolamine utilization protein EutN